MNIINHAPLWDTHMHHIFYMFFCAHLLCVAANLSLFAWSPGDMSIATIIIHIWKINDKFSIIQDVYVWFSHWPLRRVFFEYEMYHVPVISYFKSKRSTQKISQNQFVFQKDPWEMVSCVVFDMHKDTYPLSIFSGGKRERDRGWSAPGISAASMRYDAAWFWSLTFAFSCIPKNKASLPLRNYSNDLQQCMFSYSFVVGIWEHILTSQLLMQGSE